jgi:hypothetical protein
MKNIDRDICFWQKSQLFRRKLAKITENCDHIIDPWCFNILITLAQKHFIIIRTRYGSKLGQKILSQI